MSEAGTEHGASGPSRSRIACLSSAPWNPYLRLLYDALAREGIPSERRGAPSLGWLVRSRRRVRWLHVHWPEPLYVAGRGPRPLRGLLSWLKLARLALRLAVARALGYGVIWTIHQVYPHERSGPIDRAGSRVLAAFATALFAHDEATAREARDELGPRARPAVVPHGSYAGFYPPGRDRATVRRDHGIPADAFVFLSLGELRAYKEVDVLLTAFAAADLDEAALVLAGNVKDDRVGAIVRSAAARDPRIHQLVGFVPDPEIAELYGASDAAVLPRGDGGTSGTLVLALTLGVPVVAADAPSYRELVGDGAAGWLFRPGDPASLAAALERAAREPAEARAEKARAAAEVSGSLDWTATARLMAERLRA
jgi:beta-1,4-mannosyltransferase